MSFQVRRGQIFGLLGPNGAGKTTTIGVLITSVVPTNGSCSVMGIDVARDPIAVKQRIAVVPQQSNLDRSLRVREILTFPAAYHSVPRKEREERADKLLAELGLAKRKNDKVSRFSGGMAQRLMIARALMHSPDVLFLESRQAPLRAHRDHGLRKDPGEQYLGGVEENDPRRQCAGNPRSALQIRLILR